VKKLMTIAAMLAFAGMVATGCSKGSQTSSTGEATAAASPAAEATAAAAAEASPMAAEASPMAAEASPMAAEASPAAEASSAEVAAAGGAKADEEHGKTLYGANCAACHGADGKGGVGPDLHGQLKTPIMSRTESAIVGWIKDPKPPMPKLYPSPLSDKDVQDVAAYILDEFK